MDGLDGQRRILEIGCGAAHEPKHHPDTSPGGAIKTPGAVELVYLDTDVGPAKPLQNPLEGPEELAPVGFLVPVVGQVVADRCVAAIATLLVAIDDGLEVRESRVG